MTEIENEEVESESRLSDYTDEIKNGIFHLSVSMCQHLSSFIPMHLAKEHTAQWLEEIARGLRAVQENPLERKENDRSEQ
jgi:hypothetical protein